MNKSNINEQSAGTEADSSTTAEVSNVSQPNANTIVSSSAVNQQCPEFPFFGATYPDATCIDGHLWDLDKCDENGLYSSGDNPPCPFCNTEAFVDYFTDIDDKELEEMNNDENLSKEDKEEILSTNRRKQDAENWAKTLKEMYRSHCC